MNTMVGFLGRTSLSTRCRRLVTLWPPVATALTSSPRSGYFSLRVFRTRLTYPLGPCAMAVRGAPKQRKRSPFFRVIFFSAGSPPAAELTGRVNEIPVIARNQQAQRTRMGTYLLRKDQG